MRSWGLAAVVVAFGVTAWTYACGSDATSTPSDAPDGGSPAGEGGVPPAADGGGLPPAPSGPLDPAAAARAAIFMATCIGDDGVNRTLQGLYLDKNTSPFYSPAVVACLSTKTDGCRAVTECVGMKSAADGPCDGGCVGNVHQECEAPNYRLTVDCTTLGLSCKPQRGAYCAPEGAAACDPATFDGSCDDGTPVGCDYGVTVRGPRCSDLGLTCGLLAAHGSVGKLYGCKGPGAICVGAGDDSLTSATFEGTGCTGALLQACVNEAQGTLDCTAVARGFTCFAPPDAGGRAAAYCGTAAECIPGSPWDKVRATCEGTSVVFCNGGVVDKVDCTSLGFIGCKDGLCTPGFL